MSTPVVFQSSKTGEFGIGAADAATRLGTGMNMLLEGHLVSEFVAYAATPPPQAAFGQEAYEVAPENGVQQWALRNSTAPLADLQAQAVGHARDEFARRLLEGLRVDDLHVAIDGDSRSNLQAVVLAADMVARGQATWMMQDGNRLPDFRDYARGWISVEGPRIPLDTPQAGVGLALKVSAYYSALAQYEQDLEDEIAKAADPSTIDTAAGWPANTG